MTTEDLAQVWNASRELGSTTIRQLLKQITKKYNWKLGRAKLQIIKALRAGYLTTVESNIEFEKTIVKASEKMPKVEVPEIERRTTIPKKKIPQSFPYVVATIPDSVRSYDIEYKELHAAFIDLLDQATSKVKLSLPFLEPNGLWILLDSIAKVASRGVKFYVLSREIHSGRGGLSFTRKVKALIKLADIINRYGSIKGKQIQIRDFHSTVGIEGSQYQFESSHAKLVIVDDKIAYVGSGEWRENSLFYNFEVGVVLAGPPVEIIVNLYRLMWENSEPVSYADLQDFISSSS